jgi:putative phosphoribosyl transferase
MFVDRHDAGRKLAGLLDHLTAEQPVVVGVPRQGIPVAEQVATALRAPLDVLVVRRVVVPVEGRGVAVGAVGEGGVRLIDQALVAATGVEADELAALERVEALEVERQVHRYRGDLARTDLRGRTVLVVDDGIASGSTARAACRVARALGATRVVMAVPIAPEGWAERVGDDVDEMVSVGTGPEPLIVAHWYANARVVSDDDVVASLRAVASAAELQY